jgi:hypothetical protein
MTRQEVISKVRKLFELSKSSNENEAALAAAKARELLSRHNLSMADLPAEGLEDSLEIIEASVETGRLLRNWIKGLVVHVAGSFQCSHIVRRRRGSSPLLSFIGTPTDAEVAAYTFQFLYRQLNGLADKALPRLKRENPAWSGNALRYAYLDGAVRKIGERLQERTRDIHEQENRVCTALVLAKDHMIRNYISGNFGKLRKEYGTTRYVSARAYHKGYSDAERVRLRQGLENRVSADLLNA